jgi:hypothetical protein
MAQYFRPLHVVAWKHPCNIVWPFTVFDPKTGQSQQVAECDYHTMYAVQCHFEWEQKMKNDRTNTFGYIVVKDAGWLQNVFLANVKHGEYDLEWDWREDHGVAHIFFDWKQAERVVDYLKSRGEKGIRIVRLIGTNL